MDSTEREQVEILRRIAERGRKIAQQSVGFDGPTALAHAEHLDLWQHMLDEIERLK